MNRPLPEIQTLLVKTNLKPDHNAWALPAHPSVEKMGDLYLSLDLDWTGAVLFFNDAAQWLDVPTGTKKTMVIELDHHIVPQHKSWGVAAGKHIDLYTAGLSFSLEYSLITELLWYGAIDVNLFQIEFGEILSPLLYSAKEPLRVAA